MTLAFLPPFSEIANDRGRLRPIRDESAVETDAMNLDFMKSDHHVMATIIRLYQWFLFFLIFKVCLLLDERNSSETGLECGTANSEVIFEWMMWNLHHVQIRYQFILKKGNHKTCSEE